jgi:hypothetical protein
LEYENRITAGPGFRKSGAAVMYSKTTWKSECNNLLLEMRINLMDIKGSRFFGKLVEIGEKFTRIEIGWIWG